MPREWTERHIRDLIDQEYKRLGGGSAGGEKYVWSMDMPVFAPEGGATGILRRLSQRRYQLIIDFSYFSVNANDMVFFIPHLGKAVNTGDVLFIPPINYFLTTGITHTIESLTFRGIDQNNIEIPLFGIAPWTCANQLSPNRLYYNYSAGTYCRAKTAFSVGAFQRPQISSIITI